MVNHKALRCIEATTSDFMHLRKWSANTPFASRRRSLERRTLRLLKEVLQDNLRFY